MSNYFDHLLLLSSIFVPYDSHRMVSHVSECKRMWKNVRKIVSAVVCSSVVICDCVMGRCWVACRSLCRGQYHRESLSTDVICGHTACSQLIPAQREILTMLCLVTTSVMVGPEADCYLSFVCLIVFHHRSTLSLLFLSYQRNCFLKQLECLL